MNNKLFSSRQEKMVADYMGWKVVSGSGARPFDPGDVVNAHCLVECKTHDTEQANIVFRKTHWQKISTEARAKNRYPVLITDNGTQKLRNTWVLISVKLTDIGNANRIDGLANTSSKGATITFKHDNALSLFNTNYIRGKVNYLSATWGNELLAIMPLEEFKNFYEEWF